MVTSKKIVGVYASVFRAPRRLVIHRQPAIRHEQYDAYRPYTLKELLFELFDALHAHDANFLDKLDKLDDAEFQRSRHRTRRYLAEDKDVLYINSPHLTAKHVERFRGYWFATNIGGKEAGRTIGLACKAAGVKHSGISAIKL